MLLAIVVAIVVVVTVDALRVFLLPNAIPTAESGDPRPPHPGR
jgi:hypothetical protein